MHNAYATAGSLTQKPLALKHICLEVTIRKD